MNAILRAPQNVPALFSMGIDQDDAAPAAAPLSRRFVSGLAALAEVWSRDIDRAMVRYVPAIAAWSVVCFLVSKPLLRVASVAVGLSAAP